MFAPCSRRNKYDFAADEKREEAQSQTTCAPGDAYDVVLQQPATAGPIKAAAVFTSFQPLLPQNLPTL